MRGEHTHVEEEWGIQTILSKISNKSEFQNMEKPPKTPTSWGTELLGEQHQLISGVPFSTDSILARVCSFKLLPRALNGRSQSDRSIQVALEKSDQSELSKIDDLRSRKGCSSLQKLHEDTINFCLRSSVGEFWIFYEPNFWGFCQNAQKQASLNLNNFSTSRPIVSN